MRGHRLMDATSVYTAAAEAQVWRHAVEHAGVRRFCTRLLQLQRALGEQGEDSFWADVLQMLRRMRFNLCAVPLPLNHPSVVPASTLSALRRRAAEGRLMFPDYTARLEELVGVLESLSQAEEQPLLDAARLRLGTGIVGAFLLKPTRFLPDVEAHLRSLTSFPKVEIVSMSQLRADKSFGLLLAIGPAFWFPEHVFTAPRAREIHLLVYGCIRDTYAPEPAFLRASTAPPVCLVAIRQGEAVAVSADEQTPAPDLLPTILWSRFEPTGFTSVSADRASDEVTSRLFVLEGGFGVYLEAETSVVVIDLAEEEDERVRRLDLGEVNPGMFVLLRTERGGDYIASVADHLLDDDATACREQQREWKARLRASVEASSLIEVSLALLEFGSVCANEANVRNWMSLRSIRTQDPRDFLAIMRLTGFEDHAQQIWNTMGQIDRAHRRAGALIRRRLLEQVANADLAELERLGRMDFELAEAEGGQLTAFRVEEISPGTFTLPAGRLGHLFEAEAV